MKRLKAISTLLLVLSLSMAANAQLLWDDFNGGSFDPISTTTLPKTIIESKDATIPAGKRTLTLTVGDNPYNQPFSVRIQDGLLVASAGYETAASISLDYQGTKNNPMNLDLSAYQRMKISFKGKSNFARVYLNMWSNGPNRALWYGGGKTLDHFQGSIAPNGSNRGKVITIDFSELQNKNGKFKIADVDAIQVQLYSFKSTGVNYAIDKIWFE